MFGTDDRPSWRLIPILFPLDLGITVYPLNSANMFQIYRILVDVS